MIRGGLGVAVLGGLIAIGCERATDGTTERVVERILAANGRQATVEIDRERGSISVDVGGAIAPPGWPKDVPVPSTAERARIDGRSPVGWQLSIRSMQAPEEFQRSYRDELTVRGWTIEEVPNADRVEARSGSSRLAATFSARGAGSRVRIELIRGT